MPTYTYECEWGHEFEEDQAITDPPLTSCPIRIPFGGPDKCGERVKRLIPDGTTFALKGKGWEKDGYSV